MRIALVRRVWGQEIVRYVRRKRTGQARYVREAWLSLSSLAEWFSSAELVSEA
jgi:hypothetical protein